jgi:hypothetical protein
LTLAVAIGVLWVRSPRIGTVTEASPGS